MVEIVQNNVNYWKFLKKTLKIYKILPFLNKINPYKELRYHEETGEIIDSILVQHYRSLAIWTVDIHINGALINFVLAVFQYQPLHYFLVLGNGLAIWVVSKLLGMFWDRIVSGLKDIVRQLPRK